MDRTIKLAGETIPKEHIDKLAEWLKTYPKLTKGEKTIEFEKKFAEYVCCKYAVFVNSGSSANLLVLQALKEKERLKNNKIVVPAVSWITDISPVIQLGLDPIICDCNMEDLSVKLDDLEQIFIDCKPSALLFVSVLGLVPKMPEIIRLCEEYDVLLIEDCCESLGSYANDYGVLGSYNTASTFSFYWGHHMSTIEGGMVCTDDEELYESLLMTRSHGWTRDITNEIQYKEQWGISDFDSQFTFYSSGFNFRNTEIGAYLGLLQLEDIDKVVAKREANFDTYQLRIKNDYWKPNPYDGIVSNMGYPMIHPKRNEIAAKLKESGVECRPLVCGSMWNQPFYIKKYSGYNYYSQSNSKIVSEFGLYLPNHPDMSLDDIEYICSIVNSVIDGDNT